MARKKKNKNSQTFDVYPYLDQYQYLMRDGGALPWYQTKGPVRGGDAAGKPVRPNANDEAYRGNSKAFMDALNQYYKDLGVWEEENNIPEDQREKNNVNRKEEVPVEEVNTKTVEDYLNEGFSQVEAQKMFENQAVTGNDKPLGIVPQAVQDYKDGKITKEQLDKILKDNPEEVDESDGSPDGTTRKGSYDCNGTPCDWPTYVEHHKKMTGDEPPCHLSPDGCPEGEGSPEGEDYELDEVVDSGPTVQKSEYEQAVQDYKDGKISRRELDELTQRYNLGDGIKKGNTQFETKPGTSWGLLANALGSTNKALSEFGKNRINPKTGKPYEKSDFQKSTLDWSNMSNENKANIYFDEENLKKFTSGEGDDLKVSDVFKTKTMNRAENFNEHQLEQIRLAEEAGIDNPFSRQSMNRVTGETTYDDITEDVENEISNPEYEEMVKILKTRGEDVTVKADDYREQQDKLLADWKIENNIQGKMTKEQMDKFLAMEENFEYNTKVNPELEGISKTITETESVTRAHTDDDLTAGDKAMTNLKDMSTTEIIFDENGQPIKYKGYGTDGSGEGSTGTWNYDADKQYGDWEETITINKQNVLDNRKKGLNDDGTVKGSENIEETTEDGPKEVSRVTNEDFSVTITYDDGTEKTMNESSQAKKNRERLDRKNNPEGKIGLETFVYGGQPSGNKLSFTDIYAKGGDILKWYIDGEEVDEAVDDLEEVVVPEVVEPCPDTGTCTEEQTWNTETCACEVKVEDYDDDLNFSEEEINAMDEETMGDTDMIESETTYGKGTQGLKNRWGAFTKAGTSGRIMNTYGNLSESAVDWADFGNSLYDTWNNEAKEIKALNEGNDAESMFTVQESNQGIHDVNSGDRWTNKKVDEIYAGNTMKAPLIMQQGGPPPAQQAPVEESLNYSALSQFEGNNTWDSEVSYSPEVIAYQKKIMGKMRDGGSLPTYQGNDRSEVHDFLQYTPNFPRTSVVPYTGNFTAEQLQNAITRDSTQIESDLADSWIYRTLIGQDQNHQSNLGPAGKLQLNREWLHKLLNSDTDDQAELLNFYKGGGQLPMAQDGWWDNLKTKATETWENTDFKTPINKGLDKIQTAGTVGGLFPGAGNIIDLVNAGVSGARAGYAGYTGDTEGVKKHTENIATNLASAVPIAGQVVGGASLVKDAAGYAGVIDSDKSITTQITDATKEPLIAENTEAVEIDKVAKHGGEQEVEVDYETLQELIKAGADIEII